MNEQEQIEMMRRASSEIKLLRGINANLAPKADAYDRLSQVLDMMPQKSVGYSEDIAWMLDKRISEIEAAGQQAMTQKSEPSK